MKKRILLVSIIILILICCTWSIFTTDITDLTTTDAVTANEFLTTMFGKSTVTPVEFKEFQGIRTDFPGFTNYYLRYEVDDQQFILDLIKSMPARSNPETTSFTSCKQVNSSDQSVHDAFESPADDLSQVSFWKPNEVKEREYYNCLKFPWSHTLLFDRASNTIYHVVLEIWD